MKSSKIFLLAYILLLVGNILAYESIQTTQEMRRYSKHISIDQNTNSWYVTNGDYDEESSGETEDEDEDKPHADNLYDSLRNLKEVESIGTVYSGKYACREKDEAAFSVYCYDTTMQDLVDYDLQEGRLPQNDREIAITAQAGKVFSLDEEITLYIEDEEIRVTVAGILSDDQMLTADAYFDNTTAVSYTSLFNTVYDKSRSLCWYGAVMISDAPVDTMSMQEAVFIRTKAGTEQQSFLAEARKQNLSLFDLQKASDIFKQNGTKYHQEDSFTIWFYLHIAAVFLFIMLGLYHVSEKRMLYLVVAALVPWNEYLYEQYQLVKGRSLNHIFNIRLLLGMMLLDVILTAAGIGIGQLLAKRMKQGEED